MIDVQVILSNAADHAGLKRDRQQGRSPPASMSEAAVLPFFPDDRSSALASMLLFRRWRREAKGSKYVILCCWPGTADLFPDADELWSPAPSQARQLSLGTVGMRNVSSAFDEIYRRLTRYFEDVVDPEELASLYDAGLTGRFYERFGEARVFKGSVGSPASLGMDVARDLASRDGQKVYLDPVRLARRITRGRPDHVQTSIEVWTGLAKAMHEAGVAPLVRRGTGRHDLSPVLLDKCVYVSDPTAGQVLAAMRACDRTLDLFTGGAASRMSLLARSPFFCMDDRARYASDGDADVDDLCGQGISKRYLFAPPTIMSLTSRDVWLDNVYQPVLNCLASGPVAGRPSASEVDAVVPSTALRSRRRLSFGVRFMRPALGGTAGNKEKVQDGGSTREG